MAMHAVRRTFSAGREAASRTRGCVPEGRLVLAGAHGPAAGFGRDERRQPGQHHAVPRHLDSERPIAAGQAPLENVVAHEHESVADRDPKHGNSEGAVGGDAGELGRMRGGYWRYDAPFVPGSDAMNAYRTLR